MNDKMNEAEVNAVLITVGNQRNNALNEVAVLMGKMATLEANADRSIEVTNELREYIAAYKTDIEAAEGKIEELEGKINVLESPPTEPYGPNPLTHRASEVEG